MSGAVRSGQGTTIDRVAVRLSDPPRSARTTARVIAVLLPLVLIGYGLLYERNAGLTPSTETPWLHVGLYLLGGFGLYLCRRAPVIMVMCAAVCWWGTGSALFVVAASFLLALQQRPGWWAGLVALLVLHPLGLVPAPQVFAAGHALLPAEAVPVYTSVVPALIGFAAAMTLRAAGLRRAALEAEVEATRARARSEVALDRLRISREMHDILGQRLSLMVLHATAATTRDVDDEARRLLERIASDGNETIGDLHFIIGMLRQPDTKQVESPVPSLSTSIDRARAEGLTVRDLVDGSQLQRLSPAVASLVAAVAREALHNAVKYAPGSTVLVALEVGPEGVDFVVENDRPRASAAHTSVPGGFGLAELSRRAEDLGGTLSAHPTSTGGFSVGLRVSR